MNPIYRFGLTVDGGEEQQVFPVYRNDLTKEIELQSNEEFYRAKLSGKLTFVRDDYELIDAQDFDAQFGLNLYISYNGGVSWTLYWTGQFWKTDCEFDADNKNVTVTPTPIDQYTDVLAGLEKEFNLIDLAPEIVPVGLDKRPLIQVYVPGQSVIGCFLSGMWWEQECEPEDDVNKLAEIGDGKLNFALNKTARVVDVTQQATPAIPDVFFGDAWNTAVGSDTGTIDFTNGAYKFERYYETQSGGLVEQFRIVRVSDNQVMWMTGFSNVPPKTYPLELTLTPVSGSGAVGDVKIFIHDVSVYARYLCDVEQFHGENTSLIGTDDIVPNNRNYTRVIGFIDQNTIFFSTNFSDTPTPWGLYQPGKYYDQPAGSWLVGDYFPIARNGWGRVSLWFAFSAINWQVEQYGRKAYTLRDAFPIASVISVLLAKISPNLTHQETTDYSAFLYGTNPLSGISQRLLITPKSNMISLGYDQPAQKAPITLKQVLDMLRDCFRCYWYVDSENRFRIEHVSYFMNGGAYPGTPDFPKIGRRLDNEMVTRTGKAWATGTSKFRFDKPDMAARYQFGWMDDVTQLFEGNPIDILSKFVNPENIEQINVAQFTSDVDYILLNPNEISKDGFVLLSAVLVDGAYKLPYINFVLNGVDHWLQNALVAFIFLQSYYEYDMPALNYRVNGIDVVASGVKKLKTQTLNFPCYADPNPMELIKTFIGNGTIQKLSINLSSRNANATLKYDTE